MLKVTDLSLNASQEIGRVDALCGQVFALDESLVSVVEETLNLVVVEGLRMRLNELICYLHVSDGKVEHAENQIMAGLVRRINVLLQVALRVG